MPETLVRYATRSGQVELPIRFLGPDQNFVLKTEPISLRMSANIPPRLLDLMEIAAAVFCADSTVSRGALTQPRHGETWRRDLDFTFAVRDISFWQNADVTRLLRDCIEFMTDDTISSKFIESEHSPHVQSYLDLKQASEKAFQIDDVILFSGGLDSLAGTLDTLATTDRRIALVTHRSAPKTMHHQNQLIAALKKRFDGRFLWIPVLVHRKGQRSSESTQRSRSLLFSALGNVVAHMLGATRVQFFENGIVSQNLPLARPITGTLATRTTHPQTLKLLGEILSQVAGAPLSVDNPFEWMTKAQVVERLKQHGQTDLLPLTVSCNRTFKRKSDVRHCGACTQCLDRRFAVLANGLGQTEKQDDYATDILFGTRKRDDEKALAIEWVRHARRLAKMTPEEFQKRFVGELLPITRPFGNREEAIERCQKMHSRHGRAVATVLAELTPDQISSATRGSIAAVLGGEKRGSETRTAKTKPDPVPRTKTARQSSGPKQAALEIVRADNNTVSVLGLQDFSGVHARLISCLLDVLLEDRSSGQLLAEYRCLKGREVADHLNVTEDYVRTEVKRIRTSLGESWTVVFGTQPPAEILIKTIGKRGYRLDSALNVVSPERAR